MSLTSVWMQFNSNFVRETYLLLLNPFLVHIAESQKKTCNGFLDKTAALEERAQGKSKIIREEI